MDQLKTFLTALKKYHFWVLCGIVLITVLTCWWMATASLADQYHQYRSTIEAKFNDLTKLGTNPPNDKVINYVAERDSALKKNVFQTWEMLYQQQKALNSAPPELGEDFKRRFENLKPNEELDLNSRQVYQNYIKLHFPTLPLLVDARRPAPVTPDQPLGPSSEANPNNEDLYIGVVDWSEGEKKVASHIEQWTETPSTAEILLAQEDIWVYEAVLRVIRSTNKDATNQSNAVVKAIETLAIGKEASGLWKSSEESVVRGGMSATPAAAAMAPLATQSAQDQIIAQLTDGRYVDNNSNPLPPPGKGPHEEFKMMPIYLSLVMDQRQIPKFLVECANSKMPIEVRRIQLKAGTSDPLDIAAAADSGASRSVARVSKGPSVHVATTKSSGGRHGPGGDTDASQSGQYDVPVDVFGVMYLYNPPDRQKLGIGAESTEKPAEAIVPAGTSPPAAATAPPAPSPTP
jgi:hypothetical protein